MPPQTLYDFNSFDENKPLFTIDDIREINPQRFEMEQLTGILTVDREGHGLVGYKDITENEFWVRGHMPAFPLMPGVVLCECAAQLAVFTLGSTSCWVATSWDLAAWKKCGSAVPFLSVIV